jgi:hypothetical protein
MAAGQQALAERFGLTRDQVRYALKQVQGRFVPLLRDQVGSEADVGEEIRELMALLGD